MSKTSRRGALKVAGVLASLGLANSPLGRALAANADTSAAADVVAAQARLGGACVSAFPVLTPSSVREELAEVGLDGAAGPDLTRRILQAIRSDFESGRMLQVDGWYLARTEALIYAEAYYTARIA
jgi:hypothetical protein